MEQRKKAAQVVTVQVKTEQPAKVVVTVSDLKKKTACECCNCCKR